MSDERNRRPEGLGDNPLSADDLLTSAFYEPSRRRRDGPPSTPRHEPHPERPEKQKPTHYKVISISLYTEDLERLEAMVAELKRRGHTKASKSSLIRFALDQVDLDAMPRGY